MSNRPMGMYHKTPSINIGEFYICRQDPDGDDKTIWVERTNGEGAEFPEKLLESAIRAFYQEHF